MEVTRRPKLDGNVEVLKQTHKQNGIANDQVNRALSDRKSDERNISSVAKKYFKFVAYPVECLVCAIAVFYILLFLSPLLVVYNVLRFIEKQWVYLKSGSVPMSGQDALWLQDSKENRLIINCTIVVESTNVQRVVEGIKERMMQCINKKNEKGNPVFPRLTQCIHRGIFQHFLKEYDNFDINQHVYAYEGQVPRTHEEMEELVSTIICKDILFDKPPWYYVIIPKTYEGNEALVLFRLHHGMADGVSLTRFVVEEFPDEKLPENKLVKYSNVDRKWLYLNALLSGARIMIAKLLSSADCSIIHGPPPKGIKKMSWSKPISLEVVKKIKNCTGTTVNDVLMACVSMSFHDYFKAHGVSNPPNVTASVPVDVRPKNQQLVLENNFAIVSLKLPASKKAPLESLYATKAHMDDVKHSGEAFVLAIAGNLSVEYMPESITAVFTTPIANKHSFVLSNVPGPQEPFSISGHKITQVFFSPPQRNLVGIGVGLYSYAGQFSIGVSSDVNCMEDPKWIVNAFESKLAQLEKCVVSANGQIEFDSGIE